MGICRKILNLLQLTYTDWDKGVITKITRQGSAKLQMAWLYLLIRMDFGVFFLKIKD